MRNERDGKKRKKNFENAVSHDMSDQIMQGQKIEDIDRSISLSNIDSKSQYSSTRKHEKSGGNGNPMGLPGLPRDGAGIR